MENGTHWPYTPSCREYRFWSTVFAGAVAEEEEEELAMAGLARGW